MVNYLNNWISYCFITLYHNLMLSNILFYTNRYVIFIIKYHNL